ncbi:MAG: hypothetical protein AAB803_00445 [Patescibacteria group bacterium]
MSFAQWLKKHRFLIIVILFAMGVTAIKGNFSTSARSSMEESLRALAAKPPLGLSAFTKGP